jgi:hypothetical protein
MHLPLIVPKEENKHRTTPKKISIIGAVWTMRTQKIGEFHPLLDVNHLPQRSAMCIDLCLPKSPDAWQAGRHAPDRIIRA